MNRTVGRWSLIAGLIVIVIGCATMKGHWEEAATLNTVESYEEFLKRHPEGEFSDTARERLENLYFQKAENENTIASYRNFLNRYPEGKHVDQVRLRLTWLETKEIDTIEAFEKFLRLYPEGEFSDEASAKLERLYFDAAKRRNTIESYGDFLKQYPTGKLADEAHSQIESLYLQKAKETNTIEGYQDFLNRYPNGKFTAQAQVCLENLRAQLKAVEEAARKVLPDGANVEVTSISRFPEKPEFSIRAHLLEGHSADETNPYVQGDYGTHEKLTRLVTLRCAHILKSVIASTELSTASEITIEARHGVRQSSYSSPYGGTDVAMTLYRVSMTLDTIHEYNWKTITPREIMQLWIVEENILPTLQIQTEFR